MRRFAERINPNVRAALSVLADRQTTVGDYREAFYQVGRLLAQRLPLASLGDSILLACASEDADFLARGILDTIVQKRSEAPKNVAFACFWQARFSALKETPGQRYIDVAPIVKRYEEPSAELLDSLIVVKSIISSSCVVRHALLDVIGRKEPKRIFIAAPVILRGAQARLREEFPAKIGRRFEFLYFAEDDQRDERGNVLPGIGGSVYDRLGLTDRTTPRLVVERRRLHL